MEEQNKQNLENQESEKFPIDTTESADATSNDCAKKSTFVSKVKEKITEFIKILPEYTGIIGMAVMGVIIITAIVIVLVGGNRTSALCEHKYVETVYNEPTCNEYWGDGEKRFTCSKCGEWYSENIPALEHDYVESVYNEPTCDEYWGKGDKKFTCTQCGDVYYEYDSIPALEHKWTQATCTEMKKCSVCNETEGYSLGHVYTDTIDGTCTRCGFGVTFILPTTPITIMSTSGYDKTCKIESIKIERIQEYSYSYYRLTFIVESTYHEKGSNYSDAACFGWKLYDEDGLVVTSGTGYTDGGIKVGEKSKETITFYVGADEKVQNGETYRLELLNLS